MYIYLFPFGFQYTFITLPQLGHFSDTIIQPEPVSPMSQARFLHRLSGHFIFRIIPPPFPKYICCYLPARIWNKGTSLVPPVPFYHLCFIGFPSAPPISRSTGKPGMPVLPCQTVALSGIWNRRIYILLKLANDTSFLNDMLFSLFQKTSFHGISAYIYFAI